jgi:uncharacterized damage-inducible protein DinB
MPIALVRSLWEYHHWANRRLYDVTLGLGEAVAGREVGAHFSAVMSARWTTLTSRASSTLGERRPRWDHATHHRSEIATMLTMVRGSPPDTGINSYLRETEDAR